MLLIGNGGVTWVELRGMPSSITALLIAVVPAWIVLLEWLHGGPRPSRVVLGGLVLGFFGVGLLIWPAGKAGATGQTTVDPWGAALLMVACVSWAVGSLLARRAKPTVGARFSPLLPVGLQMLCGGALLLLLGLVCGEPAKIRPSQMSAASVGAFVYLLTVGSLLGFSAYSWLLQVSSPTRVSTYAYVNPVIAVLLGWLFAHEQLNGRMWFAAAIIVAGVALVIVGQTPPSPARAVIAPAKAPLPPGVAPNPE
ncbi:MAG: EamA family transporter [Verrucomicrobia bacterium]|nr:EamA family transporter [Verrucomicrobiota bacterium]